MRGDGSDRVLDREHTQFLIALISTVFFPVYGLL
jgi:hypothetical protein